MKSLGIKDVGANIARDMSLLTWTNIGLGTSLSPPATLMLTGAATEDNRPILAANLAAHLAGLKKKVALLDLDRQGLRFKKLLSCDFSLGFTDFLHRVFDEAFLTRNVSDYGFNDLMFLCHYNRRNGQVLLIPEEDDPVAVRFFDGIPVDVVNASRALYRAVLAGVTEISGLSTAEIEERLRPFAEIKQHYTVKLLNAGLIGPRELGTLYDVQVARILKSLSQTSFISFEFAGETNETYGPVRGLFPAAPSFFRAPPAEDGHILRQLARSSVATAHGFTFIPTGQFPARGATFADQFERVLPLLKKRFDVLIVNAPVFGPNMVTESVGRILDGTVLVLQSGALERRYVRGALAELERARIPVVGAVLSDVPAGVPTII